MPCVTYTDTILTYHSHIAISIPYLPQSEPVHQKVKKTTQYVYISIITIVGLNIISDIMVTVTIVHKRILMKTNRTKAVDPTTAHTLLIVMETRPVLAEASEINENTTM